MGNLLRAAHTGYAPPSRHDGKRGAGDGRLEHAQLLGLREPLTATAVSLVFYRTRPEVFFLPLDSVFIKSVANI